MSDIDPFKYWAFISYSHSDRHWAEWLIRRLETYRLPRSLVGREARDGPLPKRLFPIFRDRDELSSAPELGGEIERALRASRTLIVLCSPTSARSRWVNEEVRYFKSLGREDRVLCLIVDGVPGANDARECFAPALRCGVNADGTLSDRVVEPIAADARPQGDGRDNARLKLIAGVLGVGYDELRRRDLVARNRRLGFIAASATVIAALTVALAIAAYVARQAAERHRQQAEDLIGFMLGDLRGRLEPVGRLDVLDAVGEKAMRYFAAAEQDGQTDATLAARAKALRQIGEIRTQQGRLADAKASFDAALALSRDLAQRHPDSPQAVFDLGQSEYWAGYAAWLASDFKTARTHFLAYRETGRRLLQLEPNKPEWLQELGYGESNLGVLEEAQAQPALALGHFRAARAIAQNLAERFPEDAGYQASYADALSWTAAALERLQQFDEAQQALLQQSEIHRALMQASPRDMTLRWRYVNPLLLLQRLQASTGRLDGYATRNEEALRLSRSLVAHDPTNQDWQNALQQSYELRSIGHEFGGAWTPALNDAQVAMEMAADSYRADPQQAVARRLYVRVATAAADLQLSLGAAQDAQAKLDAVAAAAAALPINSAADLEAAVSRRLLALELAQQRPGAGPDEQRLSPEPLLQALAQQAPVTAASARLRLAVIRHTATPTALTQTPLPHCGLEHRRLLRFLRRNDVASKLSSCPVVDVYLSRKENP